MAFVKDAMSVCVHDILSEARAFEITSVAMVAAVEYTRDGSPLGAAAGPCTHTEVFGHMMSQAC